jgi:hypothetical protein
VAAFQEFLCHHVVLEALVLLERNPAIGKALSRPMRRDFGRSDRGTTAPPVPSLCESRYFMTFQENASFEDCKGSEGSKDCRPRACNLCNLRPFAARWIESSRRFITTRTADTTGINLLTSVIRSAAAYVLSAILLNRHSGNGFVRRPAYCRRVSWFLRRNRLLFPVGFLRVYYRKSDT